MPQKMVVVSVYFAFYPDGLTDGKEDEIGTQFKFPLIWNPDDKKIRTEQAIQIPFSSLVNQLEQLAIDGAGVLVIHPSYPSIEYPDAHFVYAVSTSMPSPF